MALFGQSEPFLRTQYVATGKVRIVFHDLAFLGPESFDAAVAARAADRQGAFWTYHDWLYANQGAENSGAFSRDRLVAIAAAAGLDAARFETDMADPALLAAVQADILVGQTAGFSSTPTERIVNGSVFSGVTPFATLAAAIDAAAAKH